MGVLGYFLKSIEVVGIGVVIYDVCSYGVLMLCEVVWKVVESFWKFVVVCMVLGELFILCEEEIFFLLGKGFFYKEVVDRLLIKFDMVGSYVKNIYCKFYVCMCIEVVMKYLW